MRGSTLHHYFNTSDKLSRAWRSGHLHSCSLVVRRENTSVLAAPLQATNDFWASNKDLLNLHRIRTLPDKALQERIYTIRRLGKFESYIKVSLSSKRARCE